MAVQEDNDVTAKQRKTAPEKTSGENQPPEETSTKRSRSKADKKAVDGEPKAKPGKRAKKEGPYTQYTLAKQPIPIGLPPRAAKVAGSFRCISWNIAGMRAFMKSRTDELTRLLAQETPDLLCLLETKIQDEHEADMRKQLAEVAPKYAAHFHSCTTKKGYSGVCVLSLHKADVTPLAGDDEGRAVCVRIADKPPVCMVYTPNSGEGLKRLDYRISEWDVRFRKWVAEQKGACVIGDLNAAHLDHDIWNVEAPHIPKSSGTTPEERSSFSALLDECNLVDTMRHFSPDLQGVFSYWSVRARNRVPNRGLRLDYGLVPRTLLPRLLEGFTLHEFAPNGDHCPVGFTLN
eukprot:GEMP01059424.1.p1 GENE.GEMP01059424.1~~GEMP01059424.1.p1  ORF type:complete len:347 (+),score=71.46 GEMP01059424.1:121-1161(+)